MEQANTKDQANNRVRMLFILMTSIQHYSCKLTDAMKLEKRLINPTPQALLLLCCEDIHSEKAQSSWKESERYQVIKHIQNPLGHPENSWPDFSSKYQIALFLINTIPKPFQSLCRHLILGLH
ncbi:MAG: hypothetical protein GY893_01075 [bacterium]|nr:hypothetical protein [bacterium]